ncbi:hypothetical protein PQ478_21555 (plasmid) [Alkalihalophilus pseudofirmus]|uniref:hypothetical protein n=1 Tax=Alkalihalophilus pseudofirmus TaxID=79885 RepID=UPI00259B2D4C|nr:hypothetical protein [Alkalihalophilus pseudofirmus]WEG19275.1 hypothetical protein PQ478_21555 [Alkalihalophilus pseudofirmus]
MSIHYSLDYYLRTGYLPILDRFRRDDISIELECFIGIDVCFPLHKVLDMTAQSLDVTWNALKEYVDKALHIITEQYREELDIENYDKFRDVDKEIIREIKSQLTLIPPACYPIYIITVGEGYDEKVVYIGKTSSKNHRFTGGHSAALKLHDPIYDGMMKHIYFGTVTFIDNDKEYMPLEFIQPYEDALNLLDNLEAGLIFNLKPDLNRTHRSRNNAKYDIVVNIENYSSRSNLLHNKQVYIQK